MLSRVFQAHCACGRVVFEATGVPMSTLACYCTDCQAAGEQIAALAGGGHGGLGEDGGTVSVVFRKDRVRCVRGSELLVEHKQRPESATKRMIASCCNSNVSTQFDNWTPVTLLRTFSVNVDSMKPEMCIYTKDAPDLSKIMHGVPLRPRASGGFILRVLAATALLALQRIPLGDGRLY